MNWLIYQLLMADLITNNLPSQGLLFEEKAFQRMTLPILHIIFVALSEYTHKKRISKEKIYFQKLFYPSEV